MKHRNQIRQLVPLFDKPKGEEGRKQIGEKPIFHEKKFSGPQYQSRRGMWDMLNKAPKIDHLGQPKSKRQKLKYGSSNNVSDAPTAIDANDSGNKES